MTLVIDNVNAAPATGTADPTLKVEIDVTNVPTNPVRVWTDITSYVRSASYTLAGRTAETEMTQRGSLDSLVLDNNPDPLTGRPFDRDNPESPFAAGLGWTFWIRLSAVLDGAVFPRWTGIKETIPKTRPAAGKDNVATVTGADAMRPLELFELGGLTFASAISGTLVTDVLTVVGVPAGSIDAGYPNITYPAVTYDVGDETTALTLLQSVEQDERGLIFARADGKVDFQARYYRALLTLAGPIATIGNTVGTIRYSDGDFDDDEEYRFNTVTVTPANGTPETAVDAASVGESFERTLDQDMLATSQVEARANADWYVSRYSNPDQRVGPLTIVGARCREFWPLILSAQNSDLFKWVGSASKNLITNPSFETNTAGWAGWDGAPSFFDRSNDRATVAGSHIAKVTVTGSGSIGVYYDTGNTLSGAETYTYSCYVYGDGTTNVYLRMREFDADGDVIGSDGFSTPITAAVGWQRLSITRTLGTLGVRLWLTVEQVAGAAETIYIDAAQLELAASASAYQDYWVPSVADLHLERVSESWVPGQPPTVTWDMSPASRELIWRLGVPGQSELGVTTRLG